MSGAGRGGAGAAAGPALLGPGDPLPYTEIDSRRLRRKERWNGNHEAPLHTAQTDPEHVVRWAEGRQ